MSNPNLERWGGIASKLPRAQTEPEGFLTSRIGYQIPEPVGLAYEVHYNNSGEVNNMFVVTGVIHQRFHSPYFRGLLLKALAAQFSDGQEQITFDHDQRKMRPAVVREEAWADIFRYPKLLALDLPDPRLIIKVESWSLDDMDEYILRTTKHEP